MEVDKVKKNGQDVADIEKISLKDKYSIEEKPGKKLVKYMVSMKAIGAMAGQMGKNERAREIEDWFIRFVLIDEIETHLHLELQRMVFPILTELFPKIQFIVSSHSPFILSSLKNAVIYDLEKGMLVENGLGGFPYEGIVEGYFHADRLSAELSSKFQEYREQ